MLSDLSTVKALLSDNGITPNKALGQNFFIDPDKAARIVERADVTDRAVLEIGPGLGALTQLLCERAAYVMAVEKDEQLAKLLKRTLPNGNLHVFCYDFLDINLDVLFPEHTPFCAVGNLPYYVTTPIVLKLLCALPERMTLMVQREAALRFSAAPGDRVYGALAVLAQCWYRITPFLGWAALPIIPRPRWTAPCCSWSGRRRPTASAPRSCCAFATHRWPCGERP